MFEAAWAVIQSVLNPIDLAKGVLACAVFALLAPLFRYLRQRAGNLPKKERRKGRFVLRRRLYLAGAAASVVLAAAFLGVSIWRGVTRATNKPGKSYTYSMDGAPLAAKAALMASMADGISGTTAMYQGDSMKLGVYELDEDSLFVVVKTIYADKWALIFEHAVYMEEAAASPLVTIVYRAYLDGSHKTLIGRLNGWPMDIMPVNNGYALAMAGAQGIYLVNTAAGAAVKLVNRDARLWARKYDDIYYRDKDDGGRLYAVNETSGAVTRLADDDAYYAEWDGAYVYYINADDACRVYRVHTDGTAREAVTADSAAQFDLLDGFLYYINQNDDRRLYRIAQSGDPTTREGISKYGGYNTCSRAGNEASGRWIDFGRDDELTHRYDPTEDSTDE